jgi:hypothetical protein
MTARLDRRHFLRLGVLGAAGLAAGGIASSPVAAAEGEVLYNGIRLPSPWPPRLTDIPREPSEPAYLTAPPAVIPIDVGRQLFVDDFLIARTTLTRTHHRPAYHAKNPVLTGGMVFSDGVWYDPQDRLFKMWYFASKGGTAYAISKDGMAWEKPEFDVQKGTNLVQTSPRDSSTVWLDLEEKDPQKRYKMFRSATRKEINSWCLWVHFSADGIHWTEGEPTGACGDRTTVFYNPFRKVWVYSLRSYGQPRRRRCWEAREDVVKEAQWGESSAPPLWCGSDRLDPPREDYKVAPELYNLDGAAYESIVLGLFTIWRGQFPERPKPNEVCVGYSRDGWSWSRPDRRGFCPISETKGDWNYGNVQSAGGCCLVVGDELYFYCSGRGDGWVTSLAILRRDGFASMDATDATGTLTTRPVTFRGKYLFVNADVPEGELRAEVLDERGEVVAPFSAANCVPVRADKTLQGVGWKGAPDLGPVAGKKVAFRFHLTRGKLYAFWVSPEVSGVSHGYVAAGGPGFSGLTDTVGAGR